MNRVFIVHGWEGNPNESWFPWLKVELAKAGFRVEVPQMPNAMHPKEAEWVPYISKIIGKPDQNTYLIGHSLGCITILRYLETLKVGDKIGGAVLVAGFSSDLGYDDIRNFLDHPVDWQKVKSHCTRFVAINSDNDEYVPVQHGMTFKEKLGAKLIIESKGHLNTEAGVLQLPQALDAIVGFSSNK